MVFSIAVASTVARSRTSTSSWVFPARRRAGTTSSPSAASFFSAAARVSSSPSWSISFNTSGDTLGGGAAANETALRPNSDRLSKGRTQSPPVKLAVHSAAKLPHLEELVVAGRDGPAVGQKPG